MSEEWIQEMADKELFQQRHQTDRQVNNRKSQVTKKKLIWYENKAQAW